MAISMLKIRRPLGRLIFNMGIAIPGKTVFLIETAPRMQFPSNLNYARKDVREMGPDMKTRNRKALAIWKFPPRSLLNISSGLYVQPFWNICTHNSKPWDDRERKYSVHNIRNICIITVKSGVLCNIGYLPKTHLKLKSRKISFVHN